MVSRLSAFSKAAKAHSEDQCPESRQAPDQRPEDNGGDSTLTSDSSEARDPIAHKNDPGSNSSEAPAKPQSKCPRKRQREHTPSTSSSEGHSCKKAVDATVHPPPPPSPLPLLLRLPLACPVLPVAATHTEESTSAATTGAGDTLWGTTTQDPLHAPLLYLGACKSASDEVNLSCLISYYSLKMYRPHLKLARVMQSRVKRHVVDLPSWLEAWNQYICVRLAYELAMALELVKYQTIMVMLFANHSAGRCLEYDSLFRQAAAHDPTLRWDTIDRLYARLNGMQLTSNTEIDQLHVMSILKKAFPRI